MCDPITMAAVSLSGSGLEFAQKEAQAKAANKVAGRNRELARGAAAVSFGQINERLSQEAERAGQAIANVRKEATVRKGAVAAAAASSGVKGQSVDEMLADFERQEGEFVSATLRNLEFARLSAEARKTETNLQLAGHLLSNQDVDGPDPFLSIFNAGLDAASAYQSQQLLDLQIQNQGT